MYLADENGTIIASSEALENNPKWGRKVIHNQVWMPMRSGKRAGKIFNKTMRD